MWRKTPFYHTSPLRKDTFPLTVGSPMKSTPFISPVSLQGMAMWQPSSILPVKFLACSKPSLFTDGCWLAEPHLAGKGGYLNRTKLKVFVVGLQNAIRRRDGIWLLRWAAGRKHLGIVKVWCGGHANFLLWSVLCFGSGTCSWRWVYGNPSHQPIYQFSVLATILTAYSLLVIPAVSQ